MKRRIHNIINAIRWHRAQKKLANGEDLCAVKILERVEFPVGFMPVVRLQLANANLRAGRKAEASKIYHDVIQSEHEWRASFSSDEAEFLREYAQFFDISANVQILDDFTREEMLGIYERMLSLNVRYELLKLLPLPPKSSLQSG